MRWVCLVDGCDVGECFNLLIKLFLDLLFKSPKLGQRVEILYHHHGSLPLKPCFKLSHADWVKWKVGPLVNTFLNFLRLLVPLIGEFKRLR